jgi:hypothetical protein
MTAFEKPLRDYQNKSHFRKMLGVASKISEKSLECNVYEERYVRPIPSRKLIICPI